MNNRDAIIDKILTDANNRAEEILSTATAKQKEILDKANEEAQSIFDQNNGREQELADDILKRRAVVVKLDNKKNLLTHKKILIDNVFEQAKTNFVREKGYLDIVSKMIAKYCEDGDKVAICKNDKDKITDEIIEKIAKKCGKKISLSKTHVEISGGVILVGKSCDKNLSLDLEFDTLRGQIESEVVGILFEEKK